MIFDRVPPTDPAYWHRWHPFVPVRTIEGHYQWRPVWRRKTATGWQYSDREEAPEEWQDRQW